MPKYVSLAIQPIKNKKNILKFQGTCTCCPWLQKDEVPNADTTVRLWKKNELYLRGPKI